MASRCRRGSDWLPAARRRELSELTFWELALCFALASSCFLFLLFLFCVSSVLCFLEEKSRIFLCCYYFFSARIVISRWAGRTSPAIGYSGTSARRSRRRSSVETIWQAKCKAVFVDGSHMIFAYLLLRVVPISSGHGFWTCQYGHSLAEIFLGVFLGREWVMLQSCLIIRLHRFIRMFYERW
jgi:hypothetical protein